MASTTIAYNSPFYKPASGYFDGSVTGANTPYPFPVAIGSHSYQLQWDNTAIGVWGARFKEESLPLLRQQADASNTPGEQSVSPEQFWRRSQESWHLGSGQAHIDRANSNLNRFSSSKGINVWTPWKASLLNDTSQVLTSANTSLYSCVANGYVYLTDGANLKFSSGALSSWTTVTGTPSAASSIDTDGATVYTAHGASGIYSGTVAGASVASFATGTATLVRYVKGRLMAAGNGKLYNITAAGALPTALFDKGTNWTWVDMCGGQSQIYMAGYSGNKSLIYRSAIKADATALDAPIVAGELPDGEIVRSIHAYLGYVVVGSDSGVRFCSVASDGSLTLGALVPTTSAVYCFEGQDRFVWYGATNYDATSTGLWRMDLSNFTSPLTPAYASDLMATGQGIVRSVGTLGGLRFFTVDGNGLYLETNTPVSSGALYTGLISYGISDDKVAMFVDIKHEPLSGEIMVGINADGGSYTPIVDDIDIIGVADTEGTVSPIDPYPCGQLHGEEFQLVFTLKPYAGSSPTLSRWTLRSFPTPVRTSQWNVPLLLHPTIVAGETEWHFDVDSEVSYLKYLYQSQEIVAFQAGKAIYQVTVYDFQWLPEIFDAYGNPSGTFYAQLREIVG